MADDEVVPETSHFGLTRVASGEAWSKNGWAFSDLDRTKLDQILYALATHNHSGTPALGDPTDPPTLSANAEGGALPASTTYYYRASFVDEHGLESASSDEVSVTTPDPIDPPTAPSTTVETTTGTVAPGIYSYLVTFVDTYGGETLPSSLASAQVVGTGTNRIRIDMPDLPDGIASVNVYRSRPGQSQFYLLGSTTSTTFYDEGATEDQTIVAPTVNSTNGSNSVDVTIPGGFIPQGCASWRIYRTTSAGGYDGNSLVHDVTEGADDTSLIPLTVWTDTGDSLQAGFPQNTSSTMPQGTILTLNQLDGTLPLAAMARGSQAITAFAPGAVTAGTFYMTESPADVKPVRLTAFFKTAPTETGVTVTITVTDSASNSVTLDCGASHLASGDPAGYFHASWPLIEAEAFEAESGTFSDGSVVIDNDPAAISGAAVTLDTASQWVQVPLGTLEPGTYHTAARLRALAFGTASGTNDVHIQVVNGSSTVLAETSYNLTQHSPVVNADYFYQELTGPTFTAVGGQALFLRVRKSDATNTTSYDIDSMRFTADVPALVAGPLTFSASIAGGSTSASNGNVTLWF